MVFNATFNNISAISCWSVLLVEETRVLYPEKTTDLPQENWYTCTIRLYIITLFTQLYVRVGILLTSGIHLHDHIIQVRANKSSLTPPLFIEVPVPSQEIEQSCICVLRVSILLLSTVFLLDFIELFKQCGIFIFHYINDCQNIINIQLLQIIWQILEICISDILRQRYHTKR